MNRGNGMAQNKSIMQMILSALGSAVVSNTRARAVVGQGNVPGMMTLGKGSPHAMLKMGLHSTISTNSNVKYLYHPSLCRWKLIL
jgi:hypothetical protein